MAEYKFEFVVSGKIDRIKANELGDIIEWVVNTMGLECGGDVRGTEIVQTFLCPECNHVVVPTKIGTCPNCGKIQSNWWEFKVCPACGETGHKWKDCDYEPLD